MNWIPSWHPLVVLKGVYIHSQIPTSGCSGRSYCRANCRPNCGVLGQLGHLPPIDKGGHRDTSQCDLITWLVLGESDGEKKPRAGSIWRSSSSSSSSRRRRRRRRSSGSSSSSSRRRSRSGKVVVVVVGGGGGGGGVVVAVAVVVVGGGVGVVR